MQKDHTFQIVIVTKSKGNGIDVSTNPDKTVHYNGEEQVINF
jgi:hypothetical protein